MAITEELRIIVGEGATLLVTVRDVDTGDLVDLTTLAGMEFEVKALEGNADPAFISKTIGSGITLRPQSGTTLGQAEVAILSADTTTANTDWPAAPDNVGTFRWDLWGIVGIERKKLVRPSDFIVTNPVNLP